jgi:hypothetical protein
MYVPFSVFCVFFLCKCELYSCHRVSTQLQLNIYHIISYSFYKKSPTKCEFQENQLSYKHNLLMDVSEFCTYFQHILSELRSIRHWIFHITMISECTFRENRCSESHGQLRVWKKFCTYYLNFLSIRLKFSKVDVHKNLSDYEFREYRRTECHVLRTRVTNLCFSFHIYWANMAEISKTDLQIILLSIREFCASRRRKGRIFDKVVNKITCTRASWNIMFWK